MKKLIAKVTTSFLALTLFIGQLSTNLACVGDYYQPEVPQDLKRQLGLCITGKIEKYSRTMKIKLVTHNHTKGAVALMKENS